MRKAVCHIEGVVGTDGGTPLESVAVSNGREVVVTDRRGRFALDADPVAQPFIFATRPDGADDAGWYTATPRRSGQVKLMLRGRDRRGAHGRTVHIGQITDTHFSVRSNMPTVARQLRRDLRHVHAAAPDLELLVATGDLTNRGDMPSLRHLRRILNQCACPVVPVFGACDGKNEQRELKTALPHIRHWEQVMGPTYYSIDVGPWHVVVCPAEDQYFGPDRAAMKRQWLEADLEVAAARRILLAQHPPPTPSWLEFLSQRGVEVVLYGHWHSSRCGEASGVTSFCTPPLIVGGVDAMPRGFRKISLGARSIRAPLIALTRPAPHRRAGGRSMKIRWRTQVPGCLHRGEAVCHGGALFVPVPDESYSGHCGVLCLDAETGRRKWWAPTDHSIRGTLAVTAERVFAVTQPGRLLALDRGTGRTRWSRTLTGFPHRWIHNGPVATGDVVVAGTGLGGIEAFANGTGTPRWRWAGARERTDYLPHAATPLLLGGTLAVMVHHQGVACLAAKTGRVRWRFSSHYDHSHPAMLMHRGRLLVPDAPARFHAVDPRTGRRLWTRRTGTGELVSWACDDDLLVINTVEHDLTPGGERTHAINGVTRGLAQARPAGCGRTSWQCGYGRDLVDMLPYRHGSHALAAPVVTPHAVYLAGLDGILQARDRRTGRRLSTLSLNEPIVATAALGGGPIVVLTYDGTIACIEGFAPK
ncbi:MAG: hypothetical protein CMJ18_07375 [Phycisphaeraceae bacterium]|nr:hypothetical protein [Phycisphaeraceae bacterium]